MPYLSEKIKIKKTQFDRRCKLSEDDKKYIVVLYKTENISQRKLASMFGVSRRTIQFITDEEKLKRHKELAKNRNYYNKEKNREYMKTHRKYKQQLKIDGKIS